MKFIKKILIAALSLLLAMVMVACNNKSGSNNSTPAEPTDIVTDNGLTLQLKDDNTYTIVSCSGESTSLVIPKTHNGIDITSIATGSFDNCSNITNISIPNTIVTIEREAFKGCTGLLEIEIPFVGSDLNRMESGRFDYIFGDSVPLSLKKVIVTGGTQIGAWAFGNCYSLDSIILPDGLTEIGMEAFENCWGLDSIVIPDSVTEMGGYILKGCTSIKSITIPFVGSPSYTKPIAALFDEDWDDFMLGLWDVPASLENVTFTKITEISTFMFNNCGNVKSITIPTTLEKIAGGVYTLPYNSILDIHYQGTTAQWTAIDKETNWAAGVEDYTIHCVDGIITKQ